MKDQDLIFIGLDFETSGSSHTRSAPIQIGLANSYGQTYSALIGGWRWEDWADTKWDHIDGIQSWDWSDEAEGIHNITRDLLGREPDQYVVDREASEWVASHVGIVPKGIIAVGWNIAGFDFPFLRTYLPRTASSMAFRSVDLNALIFGISQAGMSRANGEPWGYYKLKGYVKKEAEAMLYARTGREAIQHDAGDDALTSIYAFDVLKDVLRGDA